MANCKTSIYTLNSLRSISLEMSKLTRQCSGQLWAPIRRWWWTRRRSTCRRWTCQLATGTRAALPLLLPRSCFQKTQVHSSQLKKKLVRVMSLYLSVKSLYDTCFCFMRTDQPWSQGCERWVRRRRWPLSWRAVPWGWGSPWGAGGCAACAGASQQLGCRPGSSR